MALVQTLPRDGHAHGDKPFVLPRIHPDIQNFFDTERDLLFSLVDGIGSPLNLIFPENIDENIAGFESIYRKHHLRGRIYYTSKPCKSSALLRRASLSDIGLDVSSARSLQKALGCGFSADRIEATGPKNAEYILTAIQAGVLINADNFEELRLIAALHKKLALTRKTRVYVRLTGFTADHPSFTPQDDAFGIHHSETPAIIEWLLAHHDIIAFEGFSFHLSSREGVMQRIVAIEGLLEHSFAAMKQGLKPKGINIGGSYFIQYAESEEAWQDYVRNLKRSVLEEIPNQTWNNTGLGFKNENGTLGGAPMFSNHFNPIAKHDQLDAILSTRLKKFGNATIGSIISDSLLELYIEPGRAMLDQCGMTFAKVNHAKKSAWQDDLVVCDINQTNLNAHGQKNLTQSLVFYRGQKPYQENKNGFFYMGNLCVSYDVLQYNKQYPEFIPQRGDVIGFANTAAYMMDFQESETLMHPTATKVAVWKEDGKWRWALDERYMPLSLTDLEETR